MNFDLTDDQRLLVDTVSTFVRKDSPITRFRTLREEAQQQGSESVGYSKAVLHKMGELGWLGILFPESVGGLGWSMVDAALVLEQLGTTLVPEPYLASVILGGLSILYAGDEAQHARYLPSLIDGTKSLALAYAEADARYDVAHVVTRAEKTSGGYRLRGSKRFVLNGHAADSIVVSARTAGGDRDRDGVSLFVVDREAKGLSVRPVQTMDGHRAAMVTLDDVDVSADARLGSDGSATAILERVVDDAAAAACAEGLGIMTAVLQMTRDYLCQREQFSVKIGTFQVLQHRLVDMFVQTELARSTGILAAIACGDANPHTRMRSISAAKVQLATGGKFVTQESIQLHGGIGVTDEHDIGLYFKRMHVLNALFGDEEHHLERFSSLPGLRAA